MNCPGKEHRRHVAGSTVMITAVVLLTGLGGWAGAADKEASDKSANAKPASAAVVPDATLSGKSLFDGKSLTGWKITDFAGHGEVRVKDGQIILETGIMTGITWTNDLPRTNY